MPGIKNLPADITEDEIIGERNVMKTVEVQSGERLDDLQIKDYRIIQKVDGFCYGIDAVLLSDYVDIKKEVKVMDLCSGTGVVPLLIEAKYETSYLEGLEIQEDYANMAERSIRLNGLEDKIKMTCADVKKVPELYSRESFDYVTCNPPYMIASHGYGGNNPSRAVARHEILCTLDDILTAADWLLPQCGHFIMVHRPFRLAEIIYKMKGKKLEPKRMRLVYPYMYKEPNMVLIEAVKGGRERISVEPPLIVYNNDGTYTEEIRKIYGMQ